MNIHRIEMPKCINESMLCLFIELYLLLSAYAHISFLFLYFTSVIICNAREKLSQHCSIWLFSIHSHSFFYFVRSTVVWTYREREICLIDKNYLKMWYFPIFKNEFQKHINFMHHAEYEVTFSIFHSRDVCCLCCCSQK